MTKFVLEYDQKINKKLSLFDFKKKTDEKSSIKKREREREFQKRHL